MTGAGPTDDVAVREAATREDRAALHALVAGAGLPTAGLSDAWRVWVAVSGDRVVGGGALERHAGADPADPGPAYLLRSVVTSAHLRGRGVGSQIVRRSLEAIATDGGGSVALLTETAVGYFERFGFRQVPRADLPPALSGSVELQGACPASAQAYLRS